MSASDDNEHPAECPRCGSSLSYAIKGLCPRCIVSENLHENIQALDSEKPSAQFKALEIEELSAELPEIEFENLIGQGGMGAVYKGRQVALERNVAVKVLLVDDSENPEFTERFRIEAQALARLSHPNIVSVFEVGERENFVYLVMEYVSGTDLAQLIESGSIESKQSLNLVIQICQALQYSHDAGVIHRDIKPANILVDHDGNVRIADFGLAKLLDIDNGLLTVEGERLGTPLYMAPEQRTGLENVDQRADIYSLGVVFYEMLTGHLPSGKVDPPSRRSRRPISSRIDPVIMKSMEPEPERRFQSAHEVASLVAKIQAGRSPWKAAIIVTAILAVAWLAGDALLKSSAAPPSRSEGASPAEEFETIQFSDAQKAFANNPEIHDRGGHALTIRKDGVLILGAPQGVNKDAPTGSGYAAAMVQNENGHWKETHRFLPPNQKTKVRFGHSLASDDRQIFIGATLSRKIYVYDAPLGSSPQDWPLAQTLTPPKGFDWGTFGSEIALRKNRLVVSLYSVSGGAFIYERDPTSGQWGDPVFIRPIKTDRSLYSGSSVALDEGIVAVSSRLIGNPQFPNCGCVEIFEKSDGTWIQTKRIFPEPRRAKLDAGRGLAFDGPNRILVGVVGESIDNKTTGSLQIFDRIPEETDWTMSHKIFAPGKPPGSFGRRILLQDNLLLVGSDNYSGTGKDYYGCTYEYLRDPTSPSGWRIHRQFLAPPSERYRTALGYQFDRAGEWTAFGTPLADQKSGGAYVIRKSPK